MLKTEMDAPQIHTVFAHELNKTFDWFRRNFVAKINETITEFWGEAANCRLIAIFDAENNLFKGEEFFVTKVFPPNVKKKNNSSTIHVKLSKEATKMFIESVLGQNNFKTFKFEQMTELEAKVVSEFNYAVGQNLFSLCLNEGLQDISNLTQYNLLFYLKNSDNQAGKLCITIPACMIEPVAVSIHEFLFDINNFAATTTIVDIEVGKTRTTLKELKNLDVDDIIVLEDSKLSKMTLHINGETLNIKVNPDPALILNTEGNEDDFMNTDIQKNMWDTIQVEIGAEFEKIKIPLGELKQISEGLVVDLGSVYENKVNIKVENKTIASGELVIINDRYGIRIDKLHNPDEDSTITSHKKQVPPTQEENYESSEEEFDNGETDDSVVDDADEDFDYSDFDVDDEDI